MIIYFRLGGDDAALIHAKMHDMKGRFRLRTRKDSKKTLITFEADVPRDYCSICKLAARIIEDTLARKGVG
ncbi:hypothetical protein LCGC14_1335270 [marine sediment metagenome]|uniref:Uncharacterized protein n=1 Tax=marine sediment metagenome TaxID=412755 RepID=A0A0F9NHT7_9ZZZZ